MLVSPDFLFRIEQDPASYTPGKAYPVSDVELASRLSFFLWSSIPDDQLLDLAEKRQAEKRRRAAAAGAAHARRSAVRRARFRISPGSGCICATSRRPRPIRSSFRSTKRCAQAFMKETELFVASIVREDRSLLDLLTADYTFVNERLAEHYGIPKVYGSQFRRVTLTDPNRRGLLGKGSILTVTSYPESHVGRAARQVDSREPARHAAAAAAGRCAGAGGEAKDGKALSLREQMEEHRRTRSARRATRAWIRSGSRSRITTASASGATRTPAVRIDASGKLPGRHRVRGPGRADAVDGRRNTATISSGRPPRN